MNKIAVFSIQKIVVIITEVLQSYIKHGVVCRIHDMYVFLNFFTFIVHPQCGHTHDSTLLKKKARGVLGLRGVTAHGVL